MKHERVTLSMGAGGRLSSKMIEEVFLPIYGNELLNALDDAAELSMGGERIAFTTDSYTVKPIFFPGGDIGKLAICGTVNDLAVKGARARAISAAFIIEEGFLMDDLRRIARSMQQTAAALGVPVVTGDTKVVGKGEADGIFINTSGIGIILEGMSVSSSRAREGDAVIISGTLADHGMAILNARESLGFTPEIVSDVAPVMGIVESIAEFGEHIHVMRDPTRGGVAALLNEIAKASRVCIRLSEEALPLARNIRACCDLLGMDPLYIPNEGRVVVFVDPSASEDVLRKIASLTEGRRASVIGVVEHGAYSDEIPPVVMETAIGAKRFIPHIEGEPLPRIC